MIEEGRVEQAFGRSCRQPASCARMHEGRGQLGGGCCYRGRVLRQIRWMCANARGAGQLGGGCCHRGRVSRQIRWLCTDLSACPVAEDPPRLPHVPGRQRGLAVLPVQRRQLLVLPDLVILNFKNQHRWRVAVAGAAREEELQWKQWGGAVLAPMMRCVQE